MAVAGRVLMIPAGTWTSGTNYGMLDVVIYAGSSYVAKKQINNSTVAPQNAASDWQLLAQGYDVTNVVTKSMIVNNFLATDPNTVLSGPMGKSLKDQFDTLNSNLSNVSSTVTKIHDLSSTDYVTNFNGGGNAILPGRWRVYNESGTAANAPYSGAVSGYVEIVTNGNTTTNGTRVWQTLYDHNGDVYTKVIITGTGYGTWKKLTP